MKTTICLSLLLTLTGLARAGDALKTTLAIQTAGGVPAAKVRVHHIETRRQPDEFTVRILSGTTLTGPNGKVAINWGSGRSFHRTIIVEHDKTRLTVLRQDEGKASHDKAIRPNDVAPITGTVVDLDGKPLPGAQVRVLLFGRGTYIPMPVNPRRGPATVPLLTTTTDAQGRFTLPQISGHGQEGSLHDIVLLARIERDGETLEAEIYHQLYQTTDRTCRITVHPNRDLGGTIIDDVTGRPIPGARVELVGQNWVEISDEKGHFLFEDAPSYACRNLTVTGPDKLSISQSVSEIEQATRGQHVRDLAVRYRPRVTWTGQLSLDTDRPLEPGKIGISLIGRTETVKGWVHHLGFCQEPQTAFTWVGQDGGFILAVPRGTYDIEVTWQSTSNPAQHAKLHKGTIILEDDLKRPLTIKAN